MTKDTISLINFFKNLWAAVKDFTFKTRIVNQVEFPEISMPKYPDNIEVNNLIDYTDVIEGSSSDIIRYLNGAFKKLEPKNENTTKFLDKIKDEIREIKKVLDKKDLTPNVIKEIKDVVKSINNIKEPSFDLSGLEKRLTKLKKDLTKDLLKFTRYDEIKVRLPDSQVEEIGKTVIASGGGSTNVTDTLGHQINPATSDKQDDIINALGGSSSTLNTSDGVTIGSSSTTALAAETTRTEAIFVNDSNEVIYLKLGSGAEMNKGIRLNSEGGSYTCSNYTGIITAICSSGSKILTVTELKST